MIRKQAAWWRIFIFLGLLAIAWVPLALPIYLLGALSGRSGAADISALVLLYAGFLLGLPRWGQRIHRWPRPLQHCGLIFQPQIGRNLCLALAIGAMGVFLLFGVETLLGWATPTVPSPRLGQFVIEGLLVALAVAFAEGMLFRGWVLAELEKDYRPRTALMMNALFFAGTHFIKPWSEILRTFPQFLGLVVLGLALVWARRTPTSYPSRGEERTRSCLGYSIGLHAGLIWGYYIVNVGGLSDTTGRAPEWITGIDSNPLAGLLGVVLLSLIAWQFARRAQPVT